MAAALPLPNLLLPEDAAGVLEAGAAAATPPVFSAGVTVLLMFVVGELTVGASVDALCWIG